MGSPTVCNMDIVGPTLGTTLITGGPKALDYTHQGHVPHIAISSMLGGRETFRQVKGVSGIVHRSVCRSVCRRARVPGKVACGWELESEEHHFELEARV